MQRTIAQECRRSPDPKNQPSNKLELKSRDTFQAEDSISDGSLFNLAELRELVMPWPDPKEERKKKPKLKPLTLSLPMNYREKVLTRDYHLIREFFPKDLNHSFIDLSKQTTIKSALTKASMTIAIPSIFEGKNIITSVSKQRHQLYRSNAPSKIKINKISQRSYYTKKELLDEALVCLDKRHWLRFIHSDRGKKFKGHTRFLINHFFLPKNTNNLMNIH